MPDCPEIDNFTVTLERFPIPLSARVMNSSGEWLPYFQLEYCYYMSEKFSDDINKGKLPEDT
jgi:hypothetical protein